MKRGLLFILSVFLICSLFAFGESFPDKAKNVNGFVPTGWKTILSAKGDLNNDKLEDVVIVIEKTDKANIVKNENLGKLESKNTFGFVQAKKWKLYFGKQE